VAAQRPRQHTLLLSRRAQPCAYDRSNGNTKKPCQTHCHFSLAGREQILRFAQDDSLSIVILSEAKDL